MRLRKLKKKKLVHIIQLLEEDILYQEAQLTQVRHLLEDIVKCETIDEVFQSIERTAAIDQLSRAYYQ